MEPQPACYGPEHAAAFQDAGAARAYQNRPPYAPEVFARLRGLVAGEPRRVLDVGCGTGFVARPLAELVDAVDALDISPAMIAEGRRLPGGDSPRLRWIVGAAEDAALAPPYGLITAADSLHWMRWEVALPRFAALLAPGAHLAILEHGWLPLPWGDELTTIIRRFSANRDYRPVKLVEELERRGLFRVAGRVETAPWPFAQPLEAYVESFHGRSSLARARLGTEAADAFDAAVREVVRPHTGDAVTLQLVTTITYGTPGLQSAADER
jgi:SAM-dependent methyltransferase